MPGVRFHIPATKTGKMRATDTTRVAMKISTARKYCTATLSLGLALGADYDTPQLQSFFCQFS
jgi:hypothetical protein